MSESAPDSEPTPASEPAPDSASSPDSDTAAPDDAGQDNAGLDDDGKLDADTTNSLRQAYIAVGIAMIVWGIIFQPTVSLTALGTVAVGAAVYHLTRKRGAWSRTGA